jgi:hypothetical protein
MYLSCVVWIYSLKVVIVSQMYQELVNNCSIPSTQAERKNTVRSHKHSLTLCPSLSPYSQTDRQTDRDTLAAGGLEELYSSCAIVLVFLVVVEN